MLLKFFQAGQELIDEIQNSLIMASETNVAVAFVKKDGFEKIRDSLEEALKQGKIVKILIGASTKYTITDSYVLDQLVKLKQKFRTLNVKYYNSAGFHPKLFIFKMNGETKIIVGSSNLTGGGVEDNIEANVMIKISSEDDFAKSVIKSFNYWFDNGDKLKAKIAGNYIFYEKLNEESYKNRKIKKDFLIPETPIPRQHSEINVPVAEDVPLSENVNYWKVAPGPRGWQWPIWCQLIDNNKEGLIAIGWRKREKQGKIFYEMMKEDDIVVAYSRGVIFGIGKIISGAYYKRVNSLKPFSTLRKVKWIKLVMRRPPKKYIKILGTYDTVHLIKDKNAINYINSLISP